MSTIAALQQSPAPHRALLSQLADFKEAADRHIRDLESTLKRIDETKALLNEHGLQMVVDLGPVGNAAAHARTAMLADAQTERFSLPGKAA